MLEKKYERLLPTRQFAWRAAGFAEAASRLLVFALGMGRRGIPPGAHTIDHPAGAVATPIRRLTKAGFLIHPMPRQSINIADCGIQIAECNAINDTEHAGRTRYYS